jgi:general L-amino acid transport system substrate-binding protein
MLRSARLLALALLAMMGAGMTARAQTPAAAPSGSASGSPTLDAVRARGQLLCGTGGQIPGFSLLDSKGEMRGLDADYCRAIAAATLGDASKVKFVGVTAQNRFTALQSGEIDVLVRNTGWSLTREASLGLLFAGVNFWDGTSIIVKAKSGVTSVNQLEGASICVLPGTTTELDLADWARAHKINYKPVLIADIAEIRKAFLAGRCDGYTTDSSQIAGFRYMQGDQAKELTILPEPIGLGPSGAMVRKGDDKWYDIVRWTHYAQIVAEAQGVTQKNVDSFANTTVPDIRRLLGQESDLGRALGLDVKWAANIIAQVGNYGDMWERDIAPIGLPRGQNALWINGGLQFAPQLR